MLSNIQKHLDQKVAPTQPFNDKGSKISLDWSMVFNATFNDISIISWRSVLLVEETWSNRRKPPTSRKSLKLVNCLVTAYEAGKETSRNYLHVKLYFPT